MDNYFPKSSRGLTLVEVLIVLAIAGILTALAAPSFTDTTRRYRAQGEINALAGDTQFARSEAIKQGIPITICAAVNPTGAATACSNANAWQTGWIIYSADASGVKTIIKSQKSWTSTDVLKTGNAASALTYSMEGYASGLPSSGEILFTLQTTPVYALATQCLSINKAGRQKTLTPGKENCV